MYTDNPTGTECEFTFGSPYQDRGTSGTAECQRYNREHSFPRALVWRKYRTDEKRYVYRVPVR